MVGIIIDEGGSLEFIIFLQEGQFVMLMMLLEENYDMMFCLFVLDGKFFVDNDDMQLGILQLQIIFMLCFIGDFIVVVSGYGGVMGLFELEVINGFEFGLFGDVMIIFE